MALLIFVKYFRLEGPNLSSLVGNLDGIIILNNIPLDNKYTYYHIPSHSVTVKSTEMFFWNYVLLVPKKTLSPGFIQCYMVHYAGEYGKCIYNQYSNLYILRWPL